MQKLKDLFGGSKEDIWRGRSGSNTSAKSLPGAGGVKVVTDPKGFLAVPGILRASLCMSFFPLISAVFKVYLI